MGVNLGGWRRLTGGGELPIVVTNWQEEIRRRLEAAGKIAICAVGNRWRGDDGWGPVVLSLLLNASQAFSENIVTRSENMTVPILSDPTVVLIDCGDRPEDYLEELVAEKPSHILFLDAADWGGEPGSVGILAGEEMGSRCWSTHRLPLPAIFAYLRENINVEIVTLAVQVGDCGIMKELSEEVKGTAEAVAEVLIPILWQ